MFACVSACTLSSLWPGLCFRVGKILLEELSGTKSKSIFHTLCRHNQMDDVCVQENIEFSSKSQ